MTPATLGAALALLLLLLLPPVFDYAEIHGAFPGVLHLTGRFEGADLVFRGLMSAGESGARSGPSGRSWARTRGRRRGARASAGGSSRS